MRRLETLIDNCREITGNNRYDSDSGRSQKVFVEYFNNAANSLAREIINAKSKFFVKEKIVTVVSGQSLYSWPNDIFLFNVDTMEWSTNGRDYFPLSKGIIKDRFNVTSGTAFSYIPRNDGFLLNPPQTSGYVRINYIKQPSRLEKRSGKITARTMAGQVLSALTIDSTEASFDPTYISRDNYISVVDKFGAQVAKRIVFTSVNSTTGVFTLSPITLDTGETVSVGDYVCVGLDSCNLPPYPTTCEDYLMLYVEYQSKYGDASKWSAEIKNNLAAVAGQIITSFGLMSDDITQIPITCTDFL
ncbi:MAG TPA: hypothetical protein VIG33_14850 [Pseudobdellovibrionaceae bacterium]|jgi:hypothetical protein